MVDFVSLISKPHLVDLLRIFDRNKWITPRIRYASIRSKPELVADLRLHFMVTKTGDLLRFYPKRCLSCLPRIEYDLKKRGYVLDGAAFDVPRESRKKPTFSISHVPVTLDFSEFYTSPEDLQSPLSTRRASVSSEESQELGTHNHPDGLRQTAPFELAACTPRSTLSCRSASEERTRADNLDCVSLV